MARMGSATIEALHAAVTDPATVERYWNHVRIARTEECWYWLGAVSDRGHGRFQIGNAYSIGRGERRRHTFVVIAHRLGYALRHGVDALLAVPIVAHRCDNPLCQNPAHWRESDPASNRREWAARRDTIASPLADTRGARGRARALRDAARSGEELTTALWEGVSALHRDQLALFSCPADPGSPAEPAGEPATEEAQDALDS